MEIASQSYQKKHRNLRTRLALGTAIATIAFGYSGPRWRMDSMGRGRMHRHKAVGLLLTWIVLAVVKAGLHETSTGTTHRV